MEIIDSQNSDVAILGNTVVRRPRHVEAICNPMMVLIQLADVR
jgi:hypothetical protein